MYYQALKGYKIALRPNHISIFSIVYNLGNLYKDLGKLAKAKEIY